MILNEKTKQRYANFLGCIEDEILKRQGSGFTVELYPKVTSAVYFTAVSTLFGAKDYKWHLPFIHDVTEETVSKLLINKVDWSCYLSRDVERNLPKEIIVKKTLPTVILDQRMHRDPNHYNDTAYFIEGQRVYLTVPDDYAAKIFSEKYTNIGLPFCDILLSEHSIVLQEIVGHFLSPYGETHDRFLVTANGIARNNYSFCGDDDPRDYFTFEKMGMLPLNSTGQVYGMAVAIVETIKKHAPSMCDRVLHMKRQHTRQHTNGVEVWLREKQEEPPKLKSW